MKDMYEFEGPASSDLWQALAPRMLRDLGLESSIGDESMEAELWDMCFQASPWQKKGAKMNASRFMAATSKALEEDRHWHMRLWGYTHICLETDMLTGAEFNRMVVPGSAATDGPGAAGDEDAAKLRQPLPEEQMLRRACQNAMVVAMMMLADTDNQVRQRCIISAAKAIQFIMQSACMLHVRFAVP